MREPSSTALGDAFIRASHLQRSAAPVQRDGVAAALLRPEEVQRFRAGILRSLRGQREVRADEEDAAVMAWLHHESAAAPVVLLRGWYTEAVLELHARGGVDHYVVLGAGLDSFAWRRPEWALEMEVTEVDLPITQAGKLRRLDGARLPQEQARFVPADLDSAEPELALVRAASAHPTFVSFNGVSYYLGAARTLATLRALRALLPGLVEVVFDYWDEEHARPGRRSRAVESMFRSLERNREPVAEVYSEADLAALVERAGYRVVEDRPMTWHSAAARELGLEALTAPPIARFARLAPA